MSDPKDAVYVAPVTDLGEDGDAGGEGDQAGDGPDATSDAADGADGGDAGGCVADEDCAADLGANVEITCEEGQCVAACVAGYFDVNQDLENASVDEKDGCECQREDEICDGIDNDCDGSMDEDDGDLVTLCEEQRGLCGGSALNRCAFDEGASSYMMRACSVEDYQIYNSTIIEPQKFDWDCDMDINCDGKLDDRCCNGDPDETGVAAEPVEYHQQYPSLALSPGALSGDDVKTTTGLFAWEEVSALQSQDNVLNAPVLRWASGAPGGVATVSLAYHLGFVRYPHAFRVNGGNYLSWLQPDNADRAANKIAYFNTNNSNNGPISPSDIFTSRSNIGPIISLQNFKITTSPNQTKIISTWVRKSPLGSYNCGNILHGYCVVGQITTMEELETNRNLSADNFIGISATGDNSDGPDVADPYTEAYAPAAAWGESGILVAWNSARINPAAAAAERVERQEIQWRLLGEGGEPSQVLRSRVLAREEPTLEPAVVAVEGGYWLLWIERVGEGSPRQVFALRLDAQGAPVGEPIAQTGVNDKLRDLQVVALDNGAVALFWSEDDALKWAWLRPEARGEPEEMTLVEGINPAAPLRAVALDGAGFAVMYVVADTTLSPPKSRWRTLALNYDGEALCLDNP
jgi:hypothetical protein